MSVARGLVALASLLGAAAVAHGAGPVAPPREDSPVDRAPGECSLPPGTAPLRLPGVPAIPAREPAEPELLARVREALVAVDRMTPLPNFCYSIELTEAEQLLSLASDGERSLPEVARMARVVSAYGEAAETDAVGARWSDMLDLDHRRCADGSERAEAQKLARSQVAVLDALFAHQPAWRTWRFHGRRAQRTGLELRAELDGIARRCDTRSAAPPAKK